MRKTLKFSGIYKIQSICKPDRVYIGSAINTDSRRWIHLSQLRKNIHPNKKLQNHYNKYGEEDLKFEILMICEKEKLIRKEQCYINIFQPWFNICPVAGSMKGFKFSKESKLKMRNSRLNKSNSIETRKRMSITRKEMYEKDCHINNKIIEQYTKDFEFINEFPSGLIAERITGVNNGHISSVCHGKRKSAGGYIWKIKLKNNN
jgi:group I intron endonuclease